jgi:alpha-ketoglutarate-dependent taurine dioxygenase
LKIHTLPDDVGGDTLWASGYEVYDRLSPTWQKIADGLTATHYNVILLSSLQYFETDSNVLAGIPESCGGAWD